MDLLRLAESVVDRNSSFLVLLEWIAVLTIVSSFAWEAFSSTRGASRRGTVSNFDGVVVAALSICKCFLHELIGGPPFLAFFFLVGVFPSKGRADQLKRVVWLPRARELAPRARRRGRRRPQTKPRRSSGRSRRPWLVDRRRAASPLHQRRPLLLSKRSSSGTRAPAPLALRAASRTARRAAPAQPRVGGDRLLEGGQLLVAAPAKVAPDAPHVLRFARARSAGPGAARQVSVRAAAAQQMLSASQLGARVLTCVPCVHLVLWSRP